MDIRKASSILREFNEWRRGGEDNFLHRVSAETLGNAIDILINYADSSNKGLYELNREYKKNLKLNKTKTLCQ